MTIQIAHTMSQDPATAAEELRAALAGPATFVLLFASPAIAPQALASAAAQAFGETPVFGCTTAGELVSGAMLRGSAVAMAIGPEVVPAVSTTTIEDLDSDASIDAAVERLLRGLGLHLRDLDPARHVGLVLQDGTSGREERVMARLGDLTNFPFVGGSAGDDLAFQRAHVFDGGHAHAGRAALALLHTARPSRLLKTQSFEATAVRLRVTQADEATRTIHTFDDQPAARAYAAALSVPEEALARRFQSSPLGLLTDGEIFVRSPQQLTAGAVRFYCHVAPGMELHVLRAQDIVERTRTDLQDALAEFGPCAGILNFHCILRTLELRERGQEQAYADLFSSVPTVGFSTYGESYIGHINQTSTMVLLG